MKITLLHITPNAQEHIGLCASECYDSDKSREACLKRAKNCRDRGHLATYRFAHATFHIDGISRICSHQMVRSKHLDFLQKSQRYVDQAKMEQVWPKDILLNQEALSVFRAAVNECVGAYITLRKLGIKKEDARFVLPEATETSMMVVGNFQAWQDFIALRKTPEAQWEIREVATRIERILHDNYPDLF